MGEDKSKTNVGTIGHVDHGSEPVAVVTGGGNGGRARLAKVLVVAGVAVFEGERIKSKATKLHAPPEFPGISFVTDTPSGNKRGKKGKRLKDWQN